MKTKIKEKNKLLSESSKSYPPLPYDDLLIEIHNAKEEIAKEHNYDVKAILDAMKARQEQGNMKK